MKYAPYLWTSAKEKKIVIHRKFFVTNVVILNHNYVISVKEKNSLKKTMYSLHDL